MRRSWILRAGLLLLFPSLAPAECPPEAAILERLVGLDLAGSERLARFGTPTPQRLYEKAAGRIGKTFTERNGRETHAVLVAELPVESLWKAINDEEHQSLEGYVPVDHSEVIAGRPRGTERLLLQHTGRFGIDRWWIVRVTMNGELFASSRGAIWELVWEDEMDGIDPEPPGVEAIRSRFPAIRESKGAWWLVPLDQRCTLVDQYSRSDPGGVAGMLQFLVVRRAIRQSVEGIARMAAEHFIEPEEGGHEDAGFVLPDGTPLAPERHDPSQSAETTPVGHDTPVPPSPQ